MATKKTWGFWEEFWDYEFESVRQKWKRKWDKNEKMKVWENENVRQKYFNVLFIFSLNN